MNKFDFYLCDGSVIRDMKELAFSLEKMPDDVFSHHVNDHKNDFANWIALVFEEHELAEKLNSSKDRVAYQLEILKHLVNRNIYL